MEHYLHDKAKMKAIAIYTFKQLTPAQKNQVPTAHVLDALKITMLRYDPTICDSQIQDLIQTVDRLHKGFLTCDDFIQLFQKAFELLHESLNTKNIKDIKEPKSEKNTK